MLFNLHPLLRPAIMYYLFLFITYEIQVKFDAKKNQSHYRPEMLRGFQGVKVPRLRDIGPGWW